MTDATTTPPHPATDRQRGAWLGARIADALAMPVHWYYDAFALSRDYGRVTDFLAPRNPHPDSILYRSQYVAPSPRGEILHDQARYWGKRGVHYHQFLKAGENTLTLQLASIARDMLKHGDYSPAAYLDRYIASMTTPGSHRDTYIEECHRHFFHCYGKGGDAMTCGRRDEKHIGGLSLAIPVAIFPENAPPAQPTPYHAHLALTHGGPQMEEAAHAVLALLTPALDGATLREAWEDARAKHPLLQHDFPNIAKEEAFTDLAVAQRIFSPACYVDLSVPLTVYLALKYETDPEAGLIANTNIGGDNCGRGGVLGALLGAAGGAQCWPERWVRGLQPPALG